ncbi:MAG: hypothetical protein HOP11_15335, partial [Saprospiraceae bacterium]|nr:hypothetical protein [Saprospiraceae bacterium]
MTELPAKYKLGNSSLTRIEGQVLEYGTNKPLSYAKVILRESIYEPWSGGGNYIPIDTFIADSEGKYLIEFKHFPSTSTHFIDYDIYCEEFWYFSNSYGMQTGYGHRYNLVLDPYGWIDVKIKNKTPFNDEDYLFT